MRSRIRAIGLAGLLLGLGCARTEGAAPGLFDTRDSGGYRTVVLTDHACRTCVRAQPVTTLGDSADPGMLVDTWFRFVKDSLGRYWVSQPKAVNVYDAEGRFVRQVGRAGSGPFEFRMPIPLHADRDGKVHIFNANMRETVVGRDLSFEVERPFPWRPKDIAVLPDGRYVANMWIASRERIGLPLHIVDGADIVQSFGDLPRTDPTSSAFTAERVLAVDSAGRVFASPLYDLRVDVWTPSGERLGGLQGPVLNAGPVLQGAWTDDNPPASRVYALRVDDQQRLWVISWHRKPEWRDYLTTIVDRQGRERLEMRDMTTQVQELFRCRVLVVDLTTLSVAGVYRGPQMFLAFIGRDGLVAAQEYTPEGTLRVGIWNLALVPSGK